MQKETIRHKEKELRERQIDSETVRTKPTKINTQTCFDRHSSKAKKTYRLGRAGAKQTREAV